MCCGASEPVPPTPFLCLRYGIMGLTRDRPALGESFWSEDCRGEARRLVERFEWHYTPKHGSWLDMAESELGVLSFLPVPRPANPELTNAGGRGRGLGG